MPDAPDQLSPQEAIIYTMVLTAASDGSMSNSELRMIGRVVRTFPMFDGFDEEDLVEVAEACGGLMAGPDGLHRVLAAVKAALPPHLNETAYAAAIEVAAADEMLTATELRVMELLRDELDVGDEGAAAIEHSARARHMPVDPV